MLLNKSRLTWIYPQLTRVLVALVSVCEFCLFVRLFCFRRNTNYFVSVKALATRFCCTGNPSTLEFLLFLLKKNTKTKKKTNKRQLYAYIANKFPPYQHLTLAKNNLMKKIFFFFKSGSLLDQLAGNLVTESVCIFL